jgi:hypothetical protein
MTMICGIHPGLSGAVRFITPAGEFEGKALLWFDPASMQFLDASRSFARPYLAPRAQQAQA